MPGNDDDPELVKLQSNPLTGAHIGGPNTAVIDSHGVTPIPIAVPIVIRTWNSGDQVEAFWKGQAWYKGKVRNVNGDGTYNIDFNDGDGEENMPGNRIAPIGGPYPGIALVTTPQEKFEIGESVEISESSDALPDAAWNAGYIDASDLERNTYDVSYVSSLNKPPEKNVMVARIRRKYISGTQYGSHQGCCGCCACCLWFEMTFPECATCCYCACYLFGIIAYSFNILCEILQCLLCFLELLK
jgi:hypothetical protein